MLPAVNLKPPFNITRFSHVVLEVNDVEHSRDFYLNVGGLIETEFADGVSYLRGLSEACHHSLVLAPAGGKPTCRRIGYRVFLEEDLDKAKFFLMKRGSRRNGSKFEIKGGPCSSATRRALASSFAPA